MKIGNRSLEFGKGVYVLDGYTIVGPKEKESNFGQFFDKVLKSDLWGEKSYEKAECKMHTQAISGALAKTNLKPSDVDCLLSGDLLNEISASNLAARSFPCGFLGLYNACSTFGESLLLGSLLIDSENAKIVACSTSSHFSSAERQYRFPLELGNQRPPTSQWTVTGAGCTILTSENPKKCVETVVNKVKCTEICRNGETLGRFVYAKQKNQVSESEFSKKYKYSVAVKCATIGRVIDLGMDDESNMGAAMAPAAADTILTHFNDFGRTPDDYDLIVTGDLGKYGKKLLQTLLMKEGYILRDEKYQDCGAEIFTEKQHAIQGGSGAGCSNVVFNSYFLKQMFDGDLHRILFVPTGALLNKDTPLQKETIPSIAHAVVFESLNDDWQFEKK